MSGHQSFAQAISDWIDDHVWPRGSSQPQSIVVISKRNSSGTVFEFQAGFDYLQIDGIYDKGSNTLVNVQIQVVVPGHPPVVLAEADSYLVSTAEGILVSFDLENGYVKGSVFFKYGNQDGRQDIFATYSVHLPFAVDVNGVVDIAPTEVTEATGFTTTQLKDIVQFTPSELKDVEEKVLVSEYGQSTIWALNTEEQTLFVKFLKDFVVEGGGIIIETYYPGDGNALATNLTAGRFSVATADDKSSKQWHANISFLGVLELDTSVDPKTHSITATLLARVPIVGRVRLSKIQGSLAGGGVTVDINIAVAKGKVTFSASKDKRGKHDLFVDAQLDINHYRTIKTKGKTRIAVLPF